MVVDVDIDVTRGAEEGVERGKIVISVITGVGGRGVGGFGGSISKSGDTSNATMSLKRAPDAQPPKITICNDRERILRDS